MRHRTNVASTPADTDPMDEDDQAKIVASLEQEGMEHIQRTKKMFTYVCMLAMGMTAGAVLFHGSGVTQWIHAIYSAGVHWLARMHLITASTTSARSSLQSSSCILLIFLIVSPLLLLAAFIDSLNEQDTATLHWSIALSNLLVAICSILLRIESVNTMKALEVLDGSKYSYKSL